MLIVDDEEIVVEDDEDGMVDDEVEEDDDVVAEDEFIKVEPEVLEELVVPTPVVGSRFKLGGGVIVCSGMFVGVMILGILLSLGNNLGHLRFLPHFLELLDFPFLRRCFCFEIILLRGVKPLLVSMTTLRTIGRPKRSRLEEENDRSVALLLMFKLWLAECKLKRLDG